MVTGKFTHVWQKYRPAILNLMKASSSGPKEYQLYSHEFHDLNTKTTTPSFILRIHKGKKINDTKRSVLATDLLNVLQQSEKALELADHAIFEFELDKKFLLHITQEKVKVSEEEE